MKGIDLDLEVLEELLAEHMVPRDVIPKRILDEYDEHTQITLKDLVLIEFLGEKNNIQGFQISYHHKGIQIPLSFMAVNNKVYNWNFGAELETKGEAKLFDYVTSRTHVLIAGYLTLNEGGNKND